jgi:hypothetical protein
MNGICACCDEPGQIIAHGWREACYYRWYRAGKPETGPPPRTRVRMADRFDEYNHLRDGGESPADAGRRVGLQHETSIRKYEAARKALTAPYEQVAA